MTDKASAHFIVIHTLSNRFEADLLAHALEEEHVPVMLKTFEETPYDGLFVKQRGWGCLMVPDDLAFDATRIIQPLIEEIESRGLYVDPSKVDPLLWETLRQSDPQVISSNAQVRYDSSLAAYVIPFLDVELLCFPERESMEIRDSNCCHKLNFEFYLITLHYLLEAQQQGLTGNWIGEKDIPGGELFFRGHHKFSTERLVEFFGGRPDLFSAASEKLNGIKVKMGDSAYRFWPFPRIPVLFVLWEGDEEFEPSLQIRFDGSINLQLQKLDAVWAMVHVVCMGLHAAGKSLMEEGREATE